MLSLFGPANRKQLRRYLPLLLFSPLISSGQGDQNASIAAYHDRGENLVAPEEWASVWPGCAGANQAPVDLAVPATGKHFALDDFPLIVEINSCSLVYDSDMDELDMSPKWAFVDTDCTAQGQNTLSHRIFHADIHTPAEHVLNGVRYDAEFHVGFRYMDASAGVPKVLVLGFIFQGKDNGVSDHPVLAKLIAIQQMDVNATSPASLGNDWLNLLGVHSTPKSHDATFFNYFGSGDVPPCLPGIDWWIADTPIEVPKSQIDAIHANIETMARADNGTNVRPIQDLGDRLIRTGTLNGSSSASLSLKVMTALSVIIIVSLFHFLVKSL